MLRGAHIWLGIPLAICLAGYLIPNLRIGWVEDPQERFMRFFVETALGGERVTKLAPVVPVQFPPAPLGFFRLYREDVTTRFHNLLSEFHRTGVSFPQWTNRDAVGLSVTLAHEPGPGRCAAKLPDWDSGLEAQILIRVDEPGFVLDYCLIHEMTHTFGLSHSCVEFASVMCPVYMGRRLDQDKPLHLTTADQLALHVLYDPRLLRGMSSTEAISIARKILDELWSPDIERRLINERVQFARSMANRDVRCIDIGRLVGCLWLGMTKERHQQERKRSILNRP